LRNTAEYLALDEYGVDHLANVVNRGVIDDLDSADLGLHLDLAYVAATRKIR